MSNSGIVEGLTLSQAYELRDPGKVGVLVCQNSKCKYEEHGLVSKLVDKEWMPCRKCNNGRMDLMYFK